MNVGPFLLFLHTPDWFVSRRMHDAIRQLLLTLHGLVCLQQTHVELSPADAMRRLAQECEHLNVHAWDVYGDFPSNSKTATTTTTADTMKNSVEYKKEKDHDSLSRSVLRRLESEVSQAFGKDDAVFMPSGVMAQAIALLIHRDNWKCNNNNNNKSTSGEFSHAGATIPGCHAVCRRHNSPLTISLLNLC